MFRTVTVYRGEKLAIKDNWLTVSGPEGESRLPVEDLYSVVIDQQTAVLTVPVITRLTAAGVHILVCDEKHLPSSLILPLTDHYHPLSVVRRQIGLPEDIKNALWDRVVAQKIRNQAQVLAICGGEKKKIDRLTELAAEVTEGDIGNREGIAARLFFHALYGSEFVRMYDDATNAALNYGYTVIRSAVAKTLTAYGYNCVLGLHHINESNPFNLADDMMEPLRPAVDLWVHTHRDELTEALTRGQRNELAALVNTVILWNGKRMRLRNAVDQYISSLTTAVKNLAPDRLKIPEMLPPEPDGDPDD